MRVGSVRDGELARRSLNRGITELSLEAFQAPRRATHRPDRPEHHES
jgi:hypothetical protein